MACTSSQADCALLWTPTSQGSTLCRWPLSQAAGNTHHRHCLLGITTMHARCVQRQLAGGIHAVGHDGSEEVKRMPINYYLITSAALIGRQWANDFPRGPARLERGQMLVIPHWVLSILISPAAPVSCRLTAQAAWVALKASTLYLDTRHQQSITHTKG